MLELVLQVATITTIMGLVIIVKCKVQKTTTIKQAITITVNGS